MQLVFFGLRFSYTETYFWGYSFVVDVIPNFLKQIVSFWAFDLALETSDLHWLSSGVEGGLRLAK